MTDLEKMKQAVEYNGYKYNINKIHEHIGIIYLEIVGYSDGRRLALFEFDIEGNMKISN